MDKEGGGNSSGGRQQSGKVTNISCPVCGESIEGLTKLNNHLDIDHGFDNGSPEVQKRNSKNPKTSKVQQIVKNHWQRPDSYGRAVCQECGSSSKKSNAFINCRKCGLIYCNLHCKNIIKLNTDAQYDPLHGKWYACCYRCFSERPGYNDYGSFVDKTSSFIGLRETKNEDKRLRLLQLENRLVRLVNGIASIHAKCKSSILMSFTMRNEASELERTVTPWRNDRGVLDCSVCFKPFGLTLWKHHCRLCGNIVCNRDETGCSSEISLQHLVNAAKDLPYQQKVSDLAEIDHSIRLCYKCIRSLYGERKFKKDLQKPKPQLLSLCESLESTSKLITDTISHMEKFMIRMDDSKIAEQIPKEEDMTESKKMRTKLLRSVAMYNSLARQVSRITPANPTEAKIKRSVQVASSTFINEKILSLKRVPGMIDDSPRTSSPIREPDKVKSTDLLFNNLTISEVKKYREELMVLKEQKFLVESMIEEAKKQRKFDEVATLSTNLNELSEQIATTQGNLGEQGFT
ncbi:hypothetical protein ZYGR_0N04480 [Zygosaccharomyces rouxii]|uniref:ZYRO0D10560p n=2 Tax=Zygosaccharomyces rouxii TaxID=4956 RepID=C5DVZ2_ZYGRC|nr:uncharacterized protein ZYRO0D10560g [Zygosaccharomyces rouxii]KAH9200870.1 hypothetical protein LQ764DRAFT_234054 [Zygosaccharomyces rouxii]GAV49043.1 hypothetical protein ZYGR_0N04480 [Zygosaccharomyces rouxii]CAR27961.1 ZYRO0D10560p [Zygosaccharomyces rouxii]